MNFLIFIVFYVSFIFFSSNRFSDEPWVTAFYRPFYGFSRCVLPSFAGRFTANRKAADYQAVTDVPPNGARRHATRRRDCGAAAGWQP